MVYFDDLIDLYKSICFIAEANSYDIGLDVIISEVRRLRIKKSIKKAIKSYKDMIYDVDLDYVTIEKFINFYNDTIENVIKTGYNNLPKRISRIYTFSDYYISIIIINTQKEIKTTTTYSISFRAYEHAIQINKSVHNYSDENNSSKTAKEFYNYDKITNFEVERAIKREMIRYITFYLNSYALNI